MALKRTIIADQASFCEHLGNMAAEHQEAAETAGAVPRRTRAGLESALMAARHRGIAEGLELARRTVQDWDLKASLKEEGSPSA